MSWKNSRKLNNSCRYIYKQQTEIRETPLMESKQRKMNEDVQHRSTNNYNQTINFH